MMGKAFWWPFRLLWVNMVMWSSFFRSLRPHPDITKGDRFIVLRDIELNGLLHYRAPYTGGFRCTIPKDTVLIATADSQRISMGFGCIPEGEREFAKQHVPEEDRNQPNYAGYSFVLRYGDIGRKIEKVPA